MSDRNTVVSGSRMKKLFFESFDPHATDPDVGPEQLKELVAGKDGKQQSGAQESVIDAGGEKTAADEPTDLQKASMMMRFNAAMQMLDEEDHTSGVFATTENQIAALVQSALAERAKSQDSLQPTDVDGLEAKFDERDVRWAFSLVTWINKLRPHRWQLPPRAPSPIGDKMRMALFGDWGTGLYGCPRCKHSIERDGKFEAIIHLGDIYYSGTKGEVRENFLPYWPNVPGAVNRACNGNHEMYSGGYGYFDLVLPAFKQSSSCFAVQNKHWLIVGLDSAYDDHDLANHQDGWLQTLIDQAENRKVILLTHHQPFSHFDGAGDKLVGKLRPLLDSGRISVWYWGHEHRCVVYDPHPRWKFLGRCIGHSGYPYFRKPSLEFNQLVDPPGTDESFWREIPQNVQTNTPRALLLDGPNPYLAEHRDKYGPNGYLTLEFSGPKLTEHYVTAEGVELLEIEIP